MDTPAVAAAPASPSPTSVATSQDADAAPCTTFAALTPANSEARTAFDAVVRASVLEQRYEHHKNFMFVENRPRPCDAQADSSFELYDDSVTSTDHDADSADDAASSAQHLWHGYYKFDLTEKPKHPRVGWCAGKGRWTTQDMVGKVDLLLTVRAQPDIRGVHARFTFNENTAVLSVGKGSKASDVTVNGQPVTSFRPLNIGGEIIIFGRLSYRLTYTDYARTPEFASKKRDYLRDELERGSPPPYLAATPAAAPVTVDQWTISKSLGHGSAGRVFSATNARQEVVAIKRITREDERSASLVDREISTYKRLAELHGSEQDKCRLLRLRDVIFQNGKQDWLGQRFEDTWLVLEPVARCTLADDEARGVHETMRKALLHDALCGLAYMHLNGWMHTDIKPANIGVRSLNPPSAVLLDLGSSKSFNPAVKIPPTPGHGGTIGYLAPEREMQPYGASVDVWSLGVVAYELLKGQHPWLWKKNPWHPNNGALLPEWQCKYNAVLSSLTKSISDSVDDVIAQMLRHPLDGGLGIERISASAALKHVCWQPLHSVDEDRRKRTKIS